MSSFKPKFYLLILLAAFVWLTVLTFPGEKLKVIACDVGQGDAILIIKGQTQILIDGGPGSKVIDCLSKYVPFWDRKIELVVLTHPQSDHYEGLIAVFRFYKVDTFLANSLDSGNEGYKVLKNEVGGNGSRVVNPSDNIKVELGMIRLDILSPTEEFLSKNSPASNIAYSTSTSPGVLGAFSSKIDPNEFSIVVLMHYRQFDALFTGDIPPYLSDKVSKELKTDNEFMPVEYIKIPHHGSKNGLTENLLRESGASVAVISVAKKNSYGHPSPEVLDMLTRHKVEILRTDEMGHIVIETDGMGFTKHD